MREVRYGMLEVKSKRKELHDEEFLICILKNTSTSSALLKTSLRFALATNSTRDYIFYSSASPMGHPPATSQNAKQEGVSYKVARDFSIRPVFRNLFKPLTFSYLVMVKDSIMHFQDVEARVLIDAGAKELASKSEISAPSWSLFVKTGVHKSRVPSRDDWWHVRDRKSTR